MKTRVRLSSDGSEDDEDPLIGRELHASLMEYPSTAESAEERRRTREVEKAEDREE